MLLEMVWWARIFGPRTSPTDSGSTVLVVPDEQCIGEVKKQHELGRKPSHGQVRLALAIHALGARPVTHRSVKRIAPTVPTSLSPAKG
jgi:hypothetical protein